MWGHFLKKKKDKSKQLPEPIPLRIPHDCYQNPYRCAEFDWDPGNLYLSFTMGNPYEDGCSVELLVNFCPFCGYEAKNKNGKYSKFS